MVNPNCPNCNRKLNACIDPKWNLKEQELPVVGDNTICLHCGMLLMFDGINPYSYRLPTLEEAKLFCDNKELMELVKKVLG